MTHSTVQRNTPYLGSQLDSFSRFMYRFRIEANEGFTFIDIDTILRNYEKRTFALLEVKTKQAPLSYAQKRIFNEIDTALRRGTGEGWTYFGFYVLSFENTSFEDGKAWFIGQEITESDFNMWLKINF